MDINYSESFNETGGKPVLLFSRIISADDIKFTSGLSFIYEIGYQPYLLKRYEKLKKRTSKDNLTIETFRMFYKLSKKHSMQVLYTSVPK